MGLLSGVLINGAWEDWIELKWIGLDWIGLDWTGLDRAEVEWSGGNITDSSYQ